MDYKTPYSSLSGALPERLHRRRLFGNVRARSVNAPKRWLLIAIAPLIPLPLLARHRLTQVKKGNLGRYLRALPLVAALLAGWTSGEVVGYITREP